MDVNARNEAKSIITRWLGSISPAEQLVHFQIIDSLTWHYIRFGFVPDAGEFGFSQEHSEFASYMVTYFQSFTLDGVVTEFRFLEQLRPAGAAMPTLSPGSNGMNVGPPQQPDRLTLAQMKDINDHTWRGLISDRDHAQAIIGEYQALENEEVKQMWQNYQTRHELPDIMNDEELGSILSDPSKSKPYVFELFQAMVDFSDMVDRPLKVRIRKPHGKRASEQIEDDPPANPSFQDSVAVARVKNASDAVLEAMCWILLEAIVEAQRGNIYTSPWQNLKGHRLYEPYANLRDRLDAVNEALRKSKALIDNMMNTAMVRRIAAVPHDMLHRKYANKSTNEKRGVQNKAGILMLNQLRVQSEASGARHAVGDQEEEGNDQDEGYAQHDEEEEEGEEDEDEE